MNQNERPFKGTIALIACAAFFVLILLKHVPSVNLGELRPHLEFINTPWFVIAVAAFAIWSTDLSSDVG